jgi:hypothetical protein
MPGVQHRVSRFGSWSEILVESCLKTIAFTARVPHEEDVGHDFFCVLSEDQNDLFKAGPSFTVQAKSNRKPLVFKNDDQIRWLRELQNPFFLAVANRKELRVDIYSTWARFNGFLRRAAKRIILQPGPPTGGRSNPWTAEDRSEQVIALGKPIIRGTVKDFMDRRRANRFRSILRQWIIIERLNIVNAENGIYWIIGPRDYETNELPPSSDAMLWMYYHPENLNRSAVNFGRAATALRLTIHHAFGGKEGENKAIVDKIKSLDAVLLSHWEVLDSPSRRALWEWVKLKPGGKADGTDSSRAETSEGSSR